MNFNKLLYSPVGKIVISIILGLGLATFFRKACNGRNCIKFVGPTHSKIQKDTYKFDDKCYKFKTSAETCSREKKQVRFA
jgi:hypothetical protein